MIVKIGLIFISYLLGSIPFGFVLGKLKHVDIRTLGSKNIGTTNVGRILGKKYAVLTYILDCFKGFIIVFLFRFNIINEQYCLLSPMVYGLAAVLGHTFPIFLKFKGGKAVATSGGMILGYCPWLLLIAILIFFSIVYLFGYVSLGSIITSTIVTICAIILSIIEFDYILGLNVDIYFGVISIIALLIIIIRHKTNISRLINHCESKVTWSMKK